MVRGNNPEYDSWVAKGYGYGYAAGAEAGYQDGLNPKQVLASIGDLPEAMMPASKFAGSDKNKLGAQGQLKGTAPKEQPTHKLVGETDKKKGVDGKACWKGKRYAGKVKKADGTYKDKCVPIGEAYEAEMALAILKLFEGKK